MVPYLNGKDFLDCEQQDLESLIDNPDFRENEYIDYKLSFAFLEEQDKQRRNEKKVEFRNDVCSFANADGGYIIYGIGDKNGCACSIEGIEINNTDQFELNRRNDLSCIQPKIPSIQFRFIKLSCGKYVVILGIKHDMFAPYIHLVDEKNYKIYSRNGNGKKPMTYSELKQQFSMAGSLEQEILKYRKRRIEDYKSWGEQAGKSFLLLSFIPDTFKDMSYWKNMFVLEKKGKKQFSTIFTPFGCRSQSIPFVDGVKYIPFSEDKEKAEGCINNNGIVDACLFLESYLKNESYPEGFLPWEYLWNQIDEICRQYCIRMEDVLYGDRIFLCLSLIGCKNVKTEDYRGWFDYVGIIDRDEIICNPVEIANIHSAEERTKSIKRLYLSFLLAIGVKYNSEMDRLLEELYELS